MRSDFSKHVVDQALLHILLFSIYTFLSPAWHSLTAVLILDAREARFEGIIVCAL